MRLDADIVETAAFAYMSADDQRIITVEAVPRQVGDQEVPPQGEFAISATGRTRANADQVVGSIEDSLLARG